MSSLSPKNKGFDSLLKPKNGWMAIFGFILFSVLFILAGAGSLLNYLFPLGALGVGIFLYFRAPILYIGFSWWLWFLTPLVRRLSDWRSAYTEPSPLLLAPFLVTAVTLITVQRHLPTINRKGGLPFVLSLAAVFYGIALGLIFRPLTRVVISSLDWLVPVSFGFHLFVNWRDYPTYRQNIQKIFLWGIVVMGIYGIFQFVTSPPWDALWVIKADFGSGLSGRPENIERFTINVWSTMGSNRPYSTTVMAGLILLLVNKNQGKLKLPAIVAGYLSFMLARKRIVWLSWLLSLLVHTSSLKKQQQIRTLLSLVFLSICLVIVVNLPPFSDFIYSRFETFGELEGDASANARLEWFNLMIDSALLSFFGRGIGGEPHDSAILSTLFDLGWLGGLFYFGGIFSIVLFINKDKIIFADPFVSASRAIAYGVLMQLPFGRPHIEVQGMVLWTFLSMSMAARQYYQYKYHFSQQKGESSQNFNSS